MLGFVCVSCMFVANTTLLIVFFISGEVSLGMLSLFGAFMCASGLQRILKEAPQRRE